MGDISKIHFIYSWSFDKHQRELYKTNNKEYPTEQTILDDIAHVRKIWEEVNAEDKIIKGIIEILGITREYDFEFYIYGKGRLGSISTPLMLCLYPMGNERYSDTDLLEIIVHEILHRFITSPRLESKPKTKGYIDYIRTTYSHLLLATQNHILLYAVMEKLRPKIFTIDQIKEIERSLSQPLKPGYKEAIDLVKEKGPDFFIKEFTDRIINYKEIDSNE